MFWFLTASLRAPWLKSHQKTNDSNHAIHVLLLSLVMFVPAYNITPADFLHILANWPFIIMYFLIQCYVVPAVNIVLLNKTINISICCFLFLQAIIFLSDVFLLTVIILSGYDSFVLTLGSIVSSRESRLLLFPQALLTLLSRNQWQAVAPKVSLPLSA